MAVVIKESDFRNFWVNTRNFDKKILAEMKKELRKAAKPVAEDTKTAVRSIPSEAQHPLENAPRPRIGLRDSIAQSIKVGFKSGKKKAGVFLRVDARMFELLSVNGGRTGQKLGKLPRYVEGRIKRWKHPVFGRNMDTPQDWPIQKNHPFFAKTIIKHKPEFQQAVQKAMLEAIEKMEKKGYK